MQARALEARGHNAGRGVASGFSSVYGGRGSSFGADMEPPDPGKIEDDLASVESEITRVKVRMVPDSACLGPSWAPPLKHVCGAIACPYLLPAWW